MNSDRLVSAAIAAFLVFCFVWLTLASVGMWVQITRLDAIRVQTTRALEDHARAEWSLRKSVKAGNTLRSRIARKVGVPESEVEKILSGDPLGQ